jgi:hypothetical protein
MNAEGWFVDPFDRHAARWFSDGTPTALVRDPGGESQDPPPEAAWTGDLQRYQPGGDSPGGDLKRSDDAQLDSAEAKDLARGAWNVFDRTSGQF